ncbi:MAG: amidohydrolase [Chloroflexi bacterium]|nr:amidohydrolase [Chloroflexota bacterium]
MDQSTSSLLFRRTLRELAALYQCEPTEEAVEAARQQLGLAECARRCFAGQFAAFYVDDLLGGEELLPADWLASFAPVRRVLRVEALAEQLIARLPSWEAFCEQFLAILAAPGEDVIAFKTIVAYRSGLRVGPVATAAAAEAFQRLRAHAARGTPPRLADKPLNDWIVLATVAAAAAQNRPLQVHTGYGDPDLDLREADPLHLAPLIATHPATTFVLLHAGYPYVRQAGYLAWVYPNVAVDLGLPIALLSLEGMRATVAALLELAPLEKVLVSTDGYLAPERFWCAAVWARRLVAAALERAASAGELSWPEAEQFGAALLAENARRLYQHR